MAQRASTWLTSSLRWLSRTAVSVGRSSWALLRDHALRAHVAQRVADLLQGVPDVEGRLKAGKLHLRQPFDIRVSAVPAWLTSMLAPGLRLTHAKATSLSIQLPTGSQEGRVGMSVGGLELLAVAGAPDTPTAHAGSTPLDPTVWNACMAVPAQACETIVWIHQGSALWQLAIASARTTERKQLRLRGLVLRVLHHESLNGVTLNGVDHVRDKVVQLAGMGCAFTPVARFDDDDQVHGQCMSHSSPKTMSRSTRARDGKSGLLLALHWSDDGVAPPPCLSLSLSGSPVIVDANAAQVAACAAAISSLIATVHKHWDATHATAAAEAHAAKPSLTSPTRFHTEVCVDAAWVTVRHDTGIRRWHVSDVACQAVLLFPMDGVLQHDVGAGERGASLQLGVTFAALAVWRVPTGAAIACSLEPLQPSESDLLLCVPATSHMAMKPPCCCEPLSTEGDTDASLGDPNVLQLCASMAAESDTLECRLLGLWSAEVAAPVLLRPSLWSQALGFWDGVKITPWLLAFRVTVEQELKAVVRLPLAPEQRHAVITHVGVRVGEGCHLHVEWGPGAALGRHRVTLRVPDVDGHLGVIDNRAHGQRTWAQSWSLEGSRGGTGSCSSSSSSASHRKVPCFQVTAPGTDHAAVVVELVRLGPGEGELHAAWQHGLQDCLANGQQRLVACAGWGRFAGAEGDAVVQALRQAHPRGHLLSISVQHVSVATMTDYLVHGISAVMGKRGAFRDAMSTVPVSMAVFVDHLDATVRPSDDDFVVTTTDAEHGVTSVRWVIRSARALMLTEHTDATTHSALIASVQEAVLRVGNGTRECPLLMAVRRGGATVHRVLEKPGVIACCALDRVCVQPLADGTPPLRTWLHDLFVIPYTTGWRHVFHLVGRLQHAIGHSDCARSPLQVTLTGVSTFVSCPRDAHNGADVAVAVVDQVRTSVSGHGVGDPLLRMSMQWDAMRLFLAHHVELPCDDELIKAYIALRPRKDSWLIPCHKRETTERTTAAWCADYHCVARTGPVLLELLLPSDDVLRQAATVKLSSRTPGKDWGVRIMLHRDTAFVASALVHHVYERWFADAPLATVELGDTSLLQFGGMDVTLAHASEAAGLSPSRAALRALGALQQRPVLEYANVKACLLLDPARVVAVEAGDQVRVVATYEQGGSEKQVAEDWIGLYKCARSNDSGDAYARQAWNASVPDGLTFVMPKKVGWVEFRLYRGAGTQHLVARSSPLCIGPQVRLQYERLGRAVHVTWHMDANAGRPIHAPDMAATYGWQPSARDWIGMYEASELNKRNPVQYRYVTQPTVSFDVPPDGVYVFRAFADMGAPSYWLSPLSAVSSIASQSSELVRSPEYGIVRSEPTTAAWSAPSDEPSAYMEAQLRFSVRLVPEVRAWADVGTALQQECIVWPKAAAAEGDGSPGITCCATLPRLALHTFHASSHHKWHLGARAPRLEVTQGDAQLVMAPAPSEAAAAPEAALSFALSANRDRRASLNARFAIAPMHVNVTPVAVRCAALLGHAWVTPWRKGDQPVSRRRLWSHTVEQVLQQHYVAACSMERTAAAAASSPRPSIPRLSQDASLMVSSWCRSEDPTVSAVSQPWLVKQLCVDNVSMRLSLTMWPPDEPVCGMATFLSNGDAVYVRLHELQALHDCTVDLPQQLHHELPARDAWSRLWHAWLPEWQATTSAGESPLHTLIHGAGARAHLVIVRKDESAHAALRVKDTLCVNVFTGIGARIRREDDDGDDFVLI